MGDGQAMIRKITGFSLLATALLGLFPLACQPGGVGDPCVPEDEYTTTFSGYSAKEVNVESKSFQCETRVCLANHFQGRVSCKYGQAANGGTCTVPGDPMRKITVEVPPQLAKRQADKAVYCSCRCDGDDKNARYCKCPSGYSCDHLVTDIGVGDPQLAGSYCVRAGTQYDEQNDLTPDCGPIGYTSAAGGTPTCGQPDQG